MSCTSSVLSNLRDEILCRRLESRNNSKDLGFVNIMLDLVVVNTIDDSPSSCMDIAFSAFGHIPNDLKLGRWTLFELRIVELYLEDVGKFSSFNEGVWAELIFLLPFMDESFETEIAKHTHMSSIHNFLQEWKENTLSLRKSLLSVAG